MGAMGSIYKQVQELFVRETGTKVEQASQVLESLRKTHSRTDLDKLWRILNSLKSTGTTAGFPKVTRVAGKLEREVGRYREGVAIPGEDIFDYVTQGLSIIRELLQGVVRKEPGDVQSIQNGGGKSILIVDDDGVMLSILALALEKVGYEVRLANDLMTARRRLAEKTPDLLILDVMLGDDSGLDFFLEMKQSPLFLSVPILFLSAMDGKNSQASYLNLGAEDFIAKPFDMDNLLVRVNKVFQRIEEFNLATLRDPLTGTYRWRYFQERLIEEIARFQRKRLSFSVAILVLDDFDNLSQIYGRTWGDEVLREFSRFFQEKLRRSDVVARFAGNGIALMLPETPGEVARTILQRLKDKWAEKEFRCPLVSQPISVTFSGGIAAYPDHASSESLLIRGAEQALATVRQRGLDAVLLLSPDYRQRTVDSNLILVADEDMVIRRMIYDFYTERGYRVLTADNGEEAWDFLQLQRPHLLIIDYWLSRASAFQVLTKIKNQGLGEDTRVIVTFAKAPEDGLGMLNGLGLSVDVAVKPFSIEELHRKVSALVKYSSAKMSMNS